MQQGILMANSICAFDPDRTSKANLQALPIYDFPLRNKMCVKPANVHLDPKRIFMFNTELDNRQKF